MSASPILDLPAELRNSIFEYALTYSEPIVLIWRQGHSSRDQHWRLRSPEHALALARTCKEIRKECNDLLFFHNDFELRGMTMASMLLAVNNPRFSSVLLMRFHPIQSISIMPQELDATWRAITADDSSLADDLAISVGRAQYLKNSLRTERVMVKANIAYVHGKEEHRLELEMDVDHLPASCRLVQWETMGKILGQPEHEKLQELYLELQKCARQLKSMGLLPRSWV